MSPNKHCLPGQPDTLAEEALEIGSRLERGPSDRLVAIAFKKELDNQVGLSKAINEVDVAHTLVMVESGLIPIDAGIRLIEGLLTLGRAGESFSPNPAFGDLYTNREAWLRERSYPVDWLGAGRARREAITTAFQITVRASLLDLSDALISFGRTLIDKSARHLNVLMPDYTYLQASQPTTFGHYLLGFVYPVLRDLERLQSHFLRLNRSPAGCGSSNGSRVPQPRQKLCELLGFDGLVAHARDAMWQPDLPIELAALLAAVMVNLDRLAEDLQIFATEEFALIDFDDRHARASKIMPQKKNPFALTHIRGVANSIIGTLTASATMGRTPSGQPDNRLQIYGMIPRAVEDTRNALELLSEVVEFLVFKTVHARTKLENGFAMATDLADVLVLTCGLNFREARRLLGSLARERRAGWSLNQLTSDELITAAQRLLGRRIALSEEALSSALDPDTAVRARQASGGAAPESVSLMIERCLTVLSNNAEWTTRYRMRIQSAEQCLSMKVTNLLKQERDSPPAINAQTEPYTETGHPSSNQRNFPE
ncbi:MAG: argininosuccinate lyase [Gammaproteobacteria bacterium]